MLSCQFIKTQSTQNFCIKLIFLKIFWCISNQIISIINVELIVITIAIEFEKKKTIILVCCVAHFGKITVGDAI